MLITTLVADPAPIRAVRRSQDYVVFLLAHTCTTGPLAAYKTVVRKGRLSCVVCGQPLVASEGARYGPLTLNQ